MSQPIIFMFSGQGSHYYQMGRDLFEQQPLFKHWMQTADNIYQDLTGLSIIETLYHDNHNKAEPFTRTLLTHPAIFMVEYALGQVALAQGIQSSYVLGVSLGEFVAAVFAGILTFETALLAVIKQAQLLEEKCPIGNMIAIFASPELYQKDTFLQKKSFLASINFPSHFIVTLNPCDLTALETYLTAQLISFQHIPVSHGFHSPLIDAAMSDYHSFINQQTLGYSTLPFISCTLVRHLTTLSPGHFWDCIRLPIQFQMTLEKLETGNSYYYIDIGPSGTLATFVKYNLKLTSSSQYLALMTPFGQDIKNLEKLREIIKL